MITAESDYLRKGATVPTATAQYPASRYETQVRVDLGDPAERRRLTPSAVRGVQGLARAWGLTVDEACGLLGDVSPSTWHAWVQRPPRTLGFDVLTRISYLMGIYTALQILYPGPLADDWVNRPNTNSLFAGRRPLDVMTAGGIPALERVRALLDARRGG